MLTRFTLLIAALSASGFAAHDVPRNTRYLALGDSVAFGASPLISPLDASAFEGYPEFVSPALHKKVSNASCFGETSGSFLSLAAHDTGCKAWRSIAPLKAQYSGTQMQYALDYLAVNAKKTDLVTINLGANDLGLLLAGCFGDLTCAANGLPATLATYQANLITIFSSIRAVYDGPIVAVTTYAVDYTSPLVPGLIGLNGALVGVASAFDNIHVVDAFTAFQALAAGFGGSSCDADLLIRQPDNTCDIHPSAFGHSLIAEQVVALAGKK